MIKINEKNFPDVNFRNWLLEQDYAKDGVLTEETLSKVKEIDVHICAIHSLEGIEHFKALTKLNCSINQLSSLDLSHNPELKELNCSDNPLVYFDVSHNPALEKLDCSNINLMLLADMVELGKGVFSPIVLDFSHNPALRVLDCSCNIQRSLDLSHNPELRVLNCSMNELTSLDLSHNPKLVKVDCCWNSLNSLDLSHNPDLTILDCYDCQGCEEATDALIACLPETACGVIYADDCFTKEKIRAAGLKGWAVQEGPQAVVSARKTLFQEM